MKKDVRIQLFIISLLVSLCGIAAYAQPEDKGVIVLKEEAIAADEVSTSAIGDLVFDPLELTALAGYSLTGFFWTEFGAATGFWLGDIHVAGAAELRGMAYSLSVEAETQLDTLGISAGARWSSGGVQLHGGIRTTWEFLTLGARADVGPLGISLYGNATTQLGDLGLYAGAGFVESQPSASLGATLPLPGNILTISGSASFERGALAAKGGADLLLSSALTLSANAGISATGLATSVGGQLRWEILDVSSHISWTSTSISITSDARLRLASLDLLGTLRLDENSYSLDLGASMPLSMLTTKLTIGLDQQGLKWVQLEVWGEFNPLSWLPRF
jgi:hypothetical protein